MSIVIYCKLDDTVSLSVKLGQVKPRFYSSHFVPSSGDRRPMKLSVRATEALRLAPGERDRIVFDEVIPGWGLRLRESGKRYWVFQYAVPDATKTSKYATKRITFGQYPAMAVAAAREQAEKYHAQVKLGGDPQQEKADTKARSDETFEACMKLYLERRRTDG